MKRFAFVFITLLAALILTGCPGVVAEPEPDPVPDPVTYAVGDTGPSGVGIVFYITDGGLHGLEAAPEDQNGGTAAAWSTIAGAYANGSSALPSDIGTGSANTTAIIANDGGASAARICRAYTGGDVSDWFLPSRDELSQMYTQRGSIGGFVTTPGYWASSEQTTTAAHYQYFGTGTSPAFTTKSFALQVRAVRAF